MMIYVFSLFLSLSTYSSSRVSVIELSQSVLCNVKTRSMVNHGCNIMTDNKNLSVCCDAESILSTECGSASPFVVGNNAFGSQAEIDHWCDIKDQWVPSDTVKNLKTKQYLTTLGNRKIALAGETSKTSPKPFFNKQQKKEKPLAPKVRGFFKRSTTRRFSEAFDTNKFFNNRLFCNIARAKRLLLRNTKKTEKNILLQATKPDLTEIESKENVDVGVYYNYHKSNNVKPISKVKGNSRIRIEFGDNPTPIWIKPVEKKDLIAFNKERFAHVFKKKSIKPFKIVYPHLKSAVSLQDRDVKLTRLETDIIDQPERDQTQDYRHHQTMAELTSLPLLFNQLVIDGMIPIRPMATPDLLEMINFQRDSLGRTQRATMTFLSDSRVTSTTTLAEAENVALEYFNENNFSEARRMILDILSVTLGGVSDHEILLADFSHLRQTAMWVVPHLVDIVSRLSARFNWLDLEGNVIKPIKIDHKLDTNFGIVDFFTNLMNAIANGTDNTTKAFKQIYSYFKEMLTNPENRGILITTLCTALIGLVVSKTSNMLIVMATSVFIGFLGNWYSDGAIINYITGLKKTMTDYLFPNKEFSFDIKNKTPIINKEIELTSFNNSNGTIPTIELDAVESNPPKDADITSVLKFALLAFVYKQTWQTDPDKTYVENFMKQLPALAKATAGALVMTKLFDIIRDFFSFMGFTDSKINYPDLVQLSDEVQSSLANLLNPQNLNILIAEEFATYLLRVRKLRSLVKDHPHDMRLVRTVDNLEKEINKVINACQNKGFYNGGNRIEGTCTFIIGGSQVGKSTLLPRLTDDINMATLPIHQLDTWAKHKDSFKWICNPEVEYDVAYNYQNLAIMDDAFQLKDSIVSPDASLFKVIRMINACAHFIHGASIEDKTVLYTTKHLVITSNDDRIHENTNSIKSVRAVTNRLNENAYVQTPKEQFCTIKTCKNPPMTRELDVAKAMTIAHADGKYNTDVWEFHRRDVIKGKFMGQVFSYEQVLARHLECHKKKVEFAKINHSGQDKRIEDFIKKRKELEALLKDCDEELDKDQLKVNSLVDISTAPTSEQLKLYAQMNSIPLEAVKEHFKSKDIINVFDCGWWNKILFSGIDKSKGLLERCSSLLTAYPWVSITLSSLLIGSVAMTYLIPYLFTEEELKVESLQGGSVGSGSTYDQRTISTKSLSKVVGKSKVKFYRKPDAKALKALEVVSIQNLQADVVDIPLEALNGDVIDMRLCASNFKLEGGSSITINHDQVAKAIHKNNVYKISVEGNVSFGQLLMLAGRAGICPHHFMADLDEYEETNPKNYLLKFSACGVEGNGFTCRRSDIRVIRDPTLPSDCVLLLFPPIVAEHKDITNFLATQEEHARFSPSVTAALFTTRPEGGFNLTVTKAYSTRYTFEKSNLSLDNTSKKHDYAGIGYSYNVQTRGGDCGYFALTAVNGQRPKLICYHIGSRNADLNVDGSYLGLGVALVKEIIQPLVRKYNTDSVYSEFDDTNLVLQSAEVGLNIRTVGVAPKMFMPTKSKISPSPMYNTFTKPLKAPAALTSSIRNGEVYNPVFTSLSRMCKDSPYVNLDLLDAVVDANIYRQHKLSTPIVDTRILTVEEACTGAGIMPSMNRKSSAGEPLRRSLPEKGKWSIFGHGESFDFENDYFKEFKTVCLNTLEQMRNGVRPEVNFVLQLKDELRPLVNPEDDPLDPDVIQKKTRSFAIGPAHLITISRMLNGTNTAWINSNRIRNGRAVGINVYGPEWDYAQRLLAQFGKENSLDGDFQDWDVSLIYSLLYTKLKRQKAYYFDSTASDDKARKTLLECIINPVFLVQVQEFIKANEEQMKLLREDPNLEMDEEMYLVVQVCYLVSIACCNPSGQPMTTELNCDVNETATVYAICDCVLEADGGARNYTPDMNLDVNAIVDQTYILTFGDDNDLSISDNLKQYVTPRKLCEAFARIGLTFTASDKTKLGNDWKSSEDLTFLKRIWRKTAFGYDAALDQLTLDEMTQWQKDGEPDGVREDVVDGCLIEYAGWGRDVFDVKAKPIINSSIVCLGYTPKYREFSTAYRAFKHLEVVYGMDCAETVIKEVDHSNPIVINNLEADAVDREITTEFIESKEEIKEEYKAPVGKLFVNETPHDAADFFGKAYLIETGIWTTTPAEGVTLNTPFSPIKKLLTLPIFANKLDGMNGIRGNAEIRLVVNFNQYQQAGGILHLLPLADSIGSIDPSYVSMHNADIATIMQQPNVQFTAQSGTVILKVPFITPLNFYSKTLNSYDIGNVYFTVLSRLRTGTTTDHVSWSMYISLTDVEFFIPMVPQAGELSSKLEAKKVIAKPISSILFAGANLCNALSVIPNIAPLCVFPEWALATAACSAAAFGYSKPINDSNTVYVVDQTQRYSATSEGTDNAIPLSVGSQNTIKLTKDLTPYDVDELSMGFLLGVESSIAVAEPFLGTAVAGDQLCAGLDIRYISPTYMYETGTKTVGTHVATFALGPPLNYLSNCFELWRGSMILTFQFFKTLSHSARLQFTWTPHSGSIVDPTLTSSAYAIREIFDLSIADRFEVTLPWMLPYNYLHMSQYSGKWNLIVLNSIVAPSVVNADIYFNVYVRGGKDLQFAVPTNARPQIPFSLQSGINAGKIAEEGIDTVTLEPNAESVGESVSSVRQLLNRYAICTASSEPLSGSTIYYWPYHTGISYMTPVTGVQAASNLGGDLYSLIAQMYCMYRGSMNVCWNSRTVTTSGASYLRPDSTGLNVLRTTTENLFATSNWYVPTTVTAFSLGVNTDSHTPYPITYFQVPYASMTRASIRLNQSTSNNIPTESSQSLQTYVYNSNIGNVAGADIKFSRRIGEDFQFSYFVGCVPRLLTYT